METYRQLPLTCINRGRFLRNSFHTLLSRGNSTVTVNEVSSFLASSQRDKHFPEFSNQLLHDFRRVSVLLEDPRLPGYTSLNRLLTMCVIRGTTRTTVSLRALETLLAAHPNDALSLLQRLLPTPSLQPSLPLQPPNLRCLEPP
jgi:hypothetical protein